MIRLLFMVALAALALPGCKSKTAPATAQAGPTPAKQGLSATGAMQIDAADRCPVCGMAPHKHPKFASAISLKDGTTHYFCGTGCMMRGHLHPEVYLGVEAAQLDKHVTPEYFGGKHIDAFSAWWVAGSDVAGPMGPMLVPLASEADVTTFKGRHGGGQVFQLEALDDALFQTLTGKPAIKPKGQKMKLKHGH
jgi:copper chaperone NosL